VGGAGAICLLVALTGAEVEAFGIKIAGGNRTGLGVVGAALLLAAGGRMWWRSNVAPLADADRDQPEEAAGQPAKMSERRVARRPQPTPWFVGRKQLLAEVRRQLRAGRPVVLAGLGGVGKTQLALACIGRHLEDGGRGWWLRAEEAATLAGDYAALAQPLELPEREATDQELVIAAVRGWLDANSGWLLVFDNARDPEAIGGLFGGGAGQVLVTSRSWDWSDAHVVNVRPWSREESLEFLQRHAYAADEATADELADQLGDLPLALEQARAYMHQTQIPPREYVGLLRDRAHAMFARGKPASYQDQVATSWSLSLDQLRTEAPAAEDLLALCAFLAPDDIPRSLLTEHAEVLGERLRQTIEDGVAFGDAIAALGRYSLITVTDDALAVHRLVQAVIRIRLSHDDGRLWSEAAVDLLEAGFPTQPEEVANWPTFQRLLPHALAAAEHAERLGVASRQTGWLLSWAAGYLRGRGQPRQARPIAERALAVTEAALPPDDPDVAERHDELGRSLLMLGDLEGARAEVQRALAIDEIAYGPDHPYVATDHGTLGDVLRDLGDLVGAREEYERALAIRETADGVSRTEIAISHTKLAYVLRQLEDLAEARAEAQQALTIFEEIHGPDHTHVASARSALGGVLQDSGDLAGAQAEFQRALAIYEVAYGSDHPHVATAHNNLGSVLWKLGDFAGAQAEVERALAIYKVAYGSDHPHVANAHENLGAVLWASGNLAGAQAEFERALAIYEVAYGRDHPRTQGVRSHIDGLSAR
jgi:tetratricopeptide (TPR) repeat protein